MTITYIVAFLSTYVQVFLLLTFLSRRKEIVIRKAPITLPHYPSTSIIVPCYNEEATIERTVESLTNLNYPKDKLKIILVDDGSRDRTWEILSKYKDNPQIEMYRKENGGKHTAMNYALTKVTTELVGGLDADSFVHPEALKRIVTYFNDPTAMAVSSAVTVHEPKNIIQRAQKAEYDFGVFMKKMLGMIGAIHVAPGPFSIFRKKVFDDLGPYRKAHNTEDAEIALRMQKHGYKIEHCPDAYVYTVSPNTVGKLYRQRVRWIYGFLKNAKDYRELFFNKKYGNIGFFTLPAGIISICAVIYVFLTSLYAGAVFLVEKISQIHTFGFGSLFHLHGFDPFFVNTEAITFISILLWGLLIASLLIGKKMVTGRASPSMNIVYFFFLSGLLAPIWLAKAVYNAFLSKQSDWTLERKVAN